jgi:hypothetical protein
VAVGDGWTRVAVGDGNKVGVSVGFAVAVGVGIVVGVHVGLGVAIGVRVKVGFGVAGAAEFGVGEFVRPSDSDISVIGVGVAATGFVGASAVLAATTPAEDAPASCSATFVSEAEGASLTSVAVPPDVVT